MVEAKERLMTGRQASGMTVESRPMTTRSQPARPGSPSWPLARIESRMDAVSPRLTRRSQIGHFLRHFGEMCIPMCIGFVVGDLVYFWAAGLLGYSKPFSELPELSVLVVTFSMTAPMAAWMLFRGMPRRPTAEMSAAMPVLAIVLLSFGWLGALPMSGLALLEHGLMMPVMLIPMVFRLNLYTGRGSHTTPPRKPPPRAM